MKILMVCTGNICRSPTAEVVFREFLKKNSLDKKVQVDSAGTHDYHVGETPDPRAVAHARRRGYDISGLRARQVAAADFESFDLLLAMDRGHLRVMERLCAPQHRHKLTLFLDFGGLKEKEVPDPYYGGPEEFERLLDMAEAGSRGLVDHVRTHLLRVST